MKMEQTECSETLAFKLQTPVNQPEEKGEGKGTLNGLESPEEGGG
jgi:hypothetical protein